MHGINITIKEENKKLLSIMLQGINIETCQKRKRIKKKKYQSERYHMNSDLNERLKNIKEIIVLEKKIIILIIICFYIIKNE